MFDIQNRSLTNKFFYIQLLFGVIPITFGMVVFLYFVYNDYLKSNELLLATREQMRRDVVATIANVEQKSEILSQSQDIMEFVTAPPSIKSFLETRVFGKLLELSKGLELNSTLYLLGFGHNELSILSLSESDDPWAKKRFANESFKKKRPVYYLEQEYLIIIVPIVFDDQMLKGPNSNIHGAIVARIDKKLLEKRLLAGVTISSIIDEENIGSLSLTHKSTGQKYIIGISLLTIIYFLVLISVFVGLRHVRRSIILPLQSLTRSVYEKVRTGPVLNNDNEIDVLKEALSAYQRDLESKHADQIKYEKGVVMEQTARQVSHDIRSPLAALNTVVGSLEQVPEDKRLMIRNAVNRINDIANTLLENARKTKIGNVQDAHDKSGVELLPAIVDLIVSEKRVQIRDRVMISIDSDFSQAYGAFVQMNAIEFKRMLSNIINNSIEALENGAGKINIMAKRHNEMVEVTVVDNGKGMPESILNRIGEEGFSFDKSKSGSGLGIYHAKQVISKIKGQFSIRPNKEKGTIVGILLPLAKPPAWFVEAINLQGISNVVVLDDDMSIHQIWQGRFKSIGIEKLGISFYSFSSVDDFSKWCLTNDSNQNLYLIDYEFLGEKVNGLDVIEQSNIASRSILVTSRYEEGHVREKAASLHVKIIPKTMSGFVPIFHRQASGQVILIDDDPLIRMIWESRAKSKGINLVTYDSAESFADDVERIATNVEIYIDRDLPNGVKGEEYAKILFEKGFKNLILATGHEPEFFGPLPHIKKIIGKEAPW